MPTTEAKWLLLLLVLLVVRVGSYAEGLFPMRSRSKVCSSSGGRLEFTSAPHCARVDTNVTLHLDLLLVADAPSVACVVLTRRSSAENAWW